MIIKCFLTIFLPCIYISSILFLYSVWKANNINIFEYLDASEVLILGVYYLITFSPFIIILAVFSYFIFFKKISDIYLERSKGNLEVGKLFEEDYTFLLISFTLILVIYPLITAEYPSNLFYIPFLGIPFWMIISKFFPDFLSDLIPDRTLRNILIIIIITTFFCTYSFGTLYGLTSRDNYPVIEINGANKDYSLLGKTKSHYFFWDKNEEVVRVIKSELVSTLVIKSQDNNESIIERMYSLFNLVIDSKSDKKLMP